MIGMRMLNNVKFNYVRALKWNEALNIIDCQLAVAGAQGDEVARLHFERGEFWLQLGVFEMAREALEQCRTSGTAEIAQAAAERLASLPSGGDTLH